LEEEKLEAVPGVFGRAGDGDREWGCEGLEMIGDGFAADAAEHAFDSFEEVFDGKHAPGAFVLEVVEDAVADVIDEGKIGTVG
jgi:hypothetical protein|tara:strand:- start:914 stop:1162 length:249 start_codon:yes stop_codon:yes gene_type:complete